MLFQVYNLLSKFVLMRTLLFKPKYLYEYKLNQCNQLQWSWLVNVCKESRNLIYSIDHALEDYHSILIFLAILCFLGTLGLTYNFFSYKIEKKYMKKYDRKVSKSIKNTKIMTNLVDELKKSRENDEVLIKDQKKLLILENDVSTEDIPPEPLVTSTNSELVLIAQDISKKIKEKIVCSQENPTTYKNNSMQIGDVSDCHIKVERKNEVTLIQKPKREVTSSQIPKYVPPQQRSISSWSLKSKETVSQAPVAKSRKSAKNSSISNRQGIWKNTQVVQRGFSK